MYGYLDLVLDLIHDPLIMRTSTVQNVSAPLLASHVYKTFLLR